MLFLEGIPIYYEKMSQHVIRHILALLSLFFSSYLLAQNIDVNFNHGSLCSNVPIEFTNTSTITGCTSTPTFKWEFDNGFISTDENISISSLDAGSHQLTFTVTCGDVTEFASYSFVVYSPPDISYSEISFTGCAPYTVDFSSSSSQSGLTYNWSFGDGEVSSDANPTHVYNHGGDFKPILIAINAEGCKSSYEQSSIISLADPPIVSFNADVRQHCLAPAQVQFSSNVYPTNENYSYSWSFGDGGTSSTTSPSYIYSDFGQYDVSLVVSDEIGCATEIDLADYISVQALEPALIINDVEYTEGDEVVLCNGQSVKLKNATPSTYPTWTIGDFTDDDNIIYHDIEMGMNSLTLHVEHVSGLCEEDLVVPFSVEDYSINLSPIDDYICGSYATVTHTVSSDIEIASNKWYFPSSTPFSTSSNTQDHNYHEGEFYPKVISTSIHGCRDTIEGHIIVNDPEIKFVFNPNGGCNPLPVDFEYILDPVEQDIVSYQWVFGDGEETTTTGPTVSHTYNEHGDIPMSLTVTDGHGCTFTRDTIVPVGTELHAYFEVPEVDTLCPSHTDIFHFQSLSTDSTLIDFFSWTAPFPEDVITSQESHALLTFDVDTGWVDISLNVSYNGCDDDTTAENVYYINEPVIRKLHSTHNCGHGLYYPFEFTLSAQNIDSVDIDWFFYSPDGELATQYLDCGATSMDTTFPELGEYLVVVQAHSHITGCTFRDSIYAPVIVPIADFYMVDYVDGECPEKSIVFNSTNSSGAAYRKWDFGDGTVLPWDEDDNVILNHAYEEPGSYTVKLWVKDNFGCVDSLELPVLIIGTTIEILSDSIYACTPLNFDGQISLESNYPVYSYEIEIGNDELEGEDVVCSSNIDNMSMVLDIFNYFDYDDSGQYNLSIKTVTHAIKQCKSKLIDTAFFDLKDLNTHFSLYDVCYIPESDNTVSFTPIYNPDYTYAWNYGDGQEGDVAQHSYETYGKYDVTLTATDPVRGCSQTLIKPLQVIYADPVITFDFADGFGPCVPTEIFATVEGSEGIDMFDWELSKWELGVDGDGSAITIAGFGFDGQSFSDYGNLEIKFKLKASGAFCIFETEVSTELKGVEAGDIIVDPKFCIGDGLKANVLCNKTNYEYDNIIWEVVNYEDEAIDLDVDTLQLSSLPKQNDGVMLLTPTLYKDGCKQTLESESVKVYDPKAVISGDDVSFYCGNVDINFDANASVDDEWYSWLMDGVDVGSQSELNLNLQNDTDSDEYHTFKLSVGVDGLDYCKSSASTSLTLGYIPKPQLGESPTVCNYNSYQLQAHGGVSYDWSPSDYLNSTTIANPISSPIEDITYSVTVTAENSCSNIEEIDVFVQDTVFSEIDFDLDTLIIGESVQLYVESDQEGAIYSWTPVSGLSCTDCPDPVAKPEVDTHYIVKVTDSLGCYVQELSTEIIMDYLYAVDVPKAFTPQGESINSIVYVGGYGIRHLKEFSIYNRWGELMFRTDNMEEGWDGTFQGELQSSDTYVYQVIAEMYDGTIRHKKGDILLMR